MEQKNEEECRFMGNEERRVDWGRWVKVRAEEQAISSLLASPIITRTHFPEGRCTC